MWRKLYISVIYAVSVIKVKGMFQQDMKKSNLPKFQKSSFG